MAAGGRGGGGGALVQGEVNPFMGVRGGCVQVAVRNKLLRAKNNIDILARRGHN